jgi:hypothetical protein
MSQQMQDFLIKVITFLGGMSLIVLGGVVMSSNPHSESLTMMGIFLIANVTGYHAGVAVGAARKE